MDCTICGKPTLPGAMLCAPCKAALKRARYVTVQEDMRRPSVIDVRRQPRRARSPVPKATPPSGAVPLPPMRVPHHADAVPPRASSEFNSMLGRRIFVGIFVVAGLLGSASYFGLRELGAHGGDAANAPPPSPAAESRQELSASVALPGKDEPVAAPPSVAGIVVPAAIASDPQAPPTAKPQVKRTQLASRATFATANGDPPEAMYVAPEPEKPAPAPSPPPPAPDRWQTMRDAQAQCDRQGVIDGLICGQRVKMQYCDGYWGKVVQCQGANVPYER
jgi:hypothetical protein